MGEDGGGGEDALMMGGAAETTGGFASEWMKRWRQMIRCGAPYRQCQFGNVYFTV